MKTETKKIIALIVIFNFIIPIAIAWKVYNFLTVIVFAAVSGIIGAILRKEVIKGNI